MRKIVLIVLSAALIACLFAGCQQPAAQEPAASIPNPVVEVSGPEELNNPMILPEGTEGTGYAIIDDSIDEMKFTDAEGNEYMVRATQKQELADSLETFTGYYGEWKTQEGMGDIKYANVNVDGDEYYVAHWQTEDGVFYCLTGPAECQDQIVSYAEEMSGY